MILSDNDPFNWMPRLNPTRDAAPVEWPGKGSGLPRRKSEHQPRASPGGGAHTAMPGCRADAREPGDPKTPVRRGLDAPPSERVARRGTCCATSARRLTLRVTGRTAHTHTPVDGLTPTGNPFVGAFPSALVVIKASPGGIEEVAPLDNQPPSNVTWSRFKLWWNKPVLSADLSKALVGGPIQESTRRDVILWLANQDGGAHVDAMTDADYDSVRNTVFGTVHASDGTRSVVKMPIAASMRQIAHEVLVTMQDHSGVEPPLRVGDPSTQRPVRPK